MDTKTCNTMPHVTSPDVLGMASVPIQAWTEIYDLSTALKEGTIFPDLNKTFYMGGVQGGR